MAANFSIKELTTSQAAADFRREIKKAIDSIMTYWPDAGITADLQGVTIKPKKELG